MCEGPTFLFIFVSGFHETQVSDISYIIPTLSDKVELVLGDLLCVELASFL